MTRLRTFCFFVKWLVVISACVFCVGGFRQAFSVGCRPAVRERESFRLASLVDISDRKESAVRRMKRGDGLKFFKYSEQKNPR